MTKSLSDITKEIKALKGIKTDKTDKLNIPVSRGKGKKYVPKGVGNGGARVGAGRPPGGIALQRRMRKQLAEEALSSMVTMKVVDKKTGKEVTVEKPKIVAAIDQTFSIGMKGNVPALKEFLDRGLGKSAQPIVGDEDSDAIQVNVNAGEMLDKIYDNENED